MHPARHACATPDKPALIMGKANTRLSYAQLDAGSNQVAHLFRSLGLMAGDTVAILLENDPALLEIAWGAQRSGLYFVCISSRLAAPEIEHILKDSGARLLIASAPLAPVLAAIAGALATIDLLVLGGASNARDFEQARADMPITPIADQSPGGDMLYSSGTTGRPKGVRLPVPEGGLETPPPLLAFAQSLYGFGPDTVYLCPAPLYHAAPLRWSMAVQRLGGTVVVMEKFDPELALQLIERHRVTAAQWVPTHLVRLLKLPEATRSRYDLSSLKVAIHAAAPCPVPVKQAMIDWWGPILFEYYAGTEANGMTAISAAEWLRKPGSVGRAVLGTVRICDASGEPLPVGEEGLIYFENGNPFEYHNDPEKTALSRNRHGWTTLGDVGRLDQDGYLFITDRKDFMIISGGVNIYPQEIENVLVLHPKVTDVAVIGAPDPDMGERVVAVVQPANLSEAGPSLARELESFLRSHLAGLKVPRQIDFTDELPRHPTGKLYKRLLRDRYRASAAPAA